MFFKKKKENNLLPLIAVSLFVGLVAGIVGFSLASVLPFFSQVNVSDINLDRQIVIEQPRSVVVEQDQQLTQIENNLLPSLLNIYPVKNSANDLYQAYLPAEILTQGFALTADGWLVTVKDSLNLKNQYSVIGYQGKQYEVGGFVEDKTTGVVFGKMEARGLPVARLGNASKLSIGQSVAVVKQRSQLEVATIKKISYDFSARQDLVQSSEELNKNIYLDKDLDKTYDGAVVVNFKGEIVGMVSKGQVIPVDYFKGIMGQVLESQEIIRPVLGIKYIDLAQVEGLIKKGDKGALVYANPIRTSPAFDKVLKGDIIKKVNDIELNSLRGLSEVLRNYDPGDNIDLLLKRGEEEITVEVTLK